MRVVVIGAGFGGIATAIELRKHGFEDVTVLDAADGIGGTWLHNTYPGAACDVPSHLYSYSFAQRRDWSRLCSPQPEILEYLRGVARAFGVDHLVQPHSKVERVAWDEAARRWTVDVEGGRREVCDAVVIATGQLHQPAWPDLPGRETFAGTEFHSARWDHGHDLRGKRVAVIGTGASAVQFVPAIVDDVASMTIFQRSGNWFMPRRNRPYPGPIKQAIQRIKPVQRYRRWYVFHYGELLTAMIRNPKTLGRIGRTASTAFMRAQLRDPEVRRKVWPDYTFGCKRVLFSSLWLPALQKPNVEVVTDRARAITPTGIVDETGREHPVDTIIWGTGFRTNDFMFPMEVLGAGGRSLAEEWAPGAHAHLGITVPHFPSLFVMYGPNTNTSGGSIITYLEAQARYLRQALEAVRDRGAAAIEVREDVEQAFDRETQARFTGTAWTQCDSWYRDETGRVVTNWPGYMREYLEATATLDPSQYVFHEAPAREPAPAAAG